MKVKYTGADPTLQGQEFEAPKELKEVTFNLLKEENPKGRMVALAGNGEKYLLPIGDLSAVLPYKGY